MIEPTSTEAQLRDELANRLELLEPGLILRSVEYRLPNRQGAAGSVDILATDRYAATVIIEIKKSNQTARQALHELHKYIALFKYDHGLRDSQVRCMLVSTEWHELLVPFSEFSRAAPWVVDGYQLHVTPAGLPERAEKIEPVAPAAALRLCPEHKVYLFADRASRDTALPELLSMLREHNLVEHLVLKMDAKHREIGEGYNFALYLIIPEFDPDERKRARQWLATTSWADEIGAESDESIRYLEEQLMIAELTDAFFTRCDDREIGNPEKLANECLNWEIVEVIRGGSRLASKAVFSDEFLVTWAKALEGGNAVHFEMIGTPQRRLAWSEAKDNAAYCLKGNDSWAALVEAYFEAIEQTHPDATVTARFYNPCNLMMGLHRVAKFNEGDMLATAEIVVSDKDGSPFQIVLGAIVWNGKQVADVAEVLPEDIPSLFDLYFAGAIDGGPWFAEEHLMAQHGLSYVLMEFTPSPEGGRLEQLAIEDGALQRRPVDVGWKEFGAFCAAHQDYLKSLVEDIDSWALLS